MAASLNETPFANRLHIGVFGKTNSGKSSFINAFIRQKVSIVADVAGTTTDPVYKPMEIYPLGPCVIIDTAGFGDDGALGELRMEKTKLAAQKTELAIILFDGMQMEEELSWYRYFQSRETPALLLVNKSDIRTDTQKILEEIKKQTGERAFAVSASTGSGIEQVREALSRRLPEGYGSRFITGELLAENDLVMLVMPQDIQAPKGRLILPQVQTLRELLDKKCQVMCVTTGRFCSALLLLRYPPKLIITDSQAFDYIYKQKPAESMLTSFSILFAAYKGDLSYYLAGAQKIDSLRPDSRVLIAECCTHAPLKEDIGREKIPALLRKRFGSSLTIDLVSGTDFPQDLTPYDLVIQCGGCMFNRKYVLFRIDRARKQNVPMTNYGVALAHLAGILDKVTLP